MTALHLRNVTAGYAASQVLHDVTLHVEPGETVAVLGANGAGKTTLLRAAMSMISVEGTVEFDGRSTTGLAPDRVARLGLTHVPEGRGTFTDLTVEENLDLAGSNSSRTQSRSRREFVYEVFPRLAERRTQPAGTLSGGEQQMVALGRAVMCEPKCLLLDEPSLGLAPIITAEIFNVFGDLRNELQCSILLIEQNARLALNHSDRAYVMEAGRVVESGTTDELSGSDLVRKAYLGY